MDPIAFWKQIGGKQMPSEADLKAFLALGDEAIVAALLQVVMIPQDVAKSKQIMEGLAWGLPREFQRVRQAIEKPQAVEQEASEGFEDLALDDEEVSFAQIASQELAIFKGMISQRMKMMSSGAIDEIRSVLVQNA
jgi:hypothetical protein